MTGADITGAAGRNTVLALAPRNDRKFYKDYSIHYHKKNTFDSLWPVWIIVASKHHTSHDRVSVVRTTFKVYGKRQTLTLSQPKTPEPIVTKFEWRDYVVDPYHKKLGLNPPRGFCSPYRWNKHPSCSKFTTLFVSSTRLQASPLDRFLRLIRQMTRFCARTVSYTHLTLPTNREV